MQLPLSVSAALTLSPTSIPQLNDGSLPSVVVVLVMGLPAAGKSTFIHQLANTPSLVVHHICVDELYDQQLQQPTATLRFTSSFSPALWHTARDAAYCRTVELLHALASSTPGNPSVCNVVSVDDVFHLRSMRHVYYHLCRGQRIPFHQLLMNTSLATCLSNLATRFASGPNTMSAAHSQLTAEYVAALSERFDWPTEVEMRYTTVANTATTTCMPDISFLRFASIPQPAAHAANEPTVAHVQSIVHEIDISLRHAIGQRMSEWSAQQRQTQLQPDGHTSATVANYAREANELRKRVLIDARRPGTAVYELMQADEEGNEGEDEKIQLQAAVYRAVSYFNSLIDSTRPAVVPHTDPT